MALNIVIMAAGKGTRMRSSLPKVLHRLAGRPMLEHVVRRALSLKPTRLVVVVGHGAADVEAAMRATFPDAPWHFVLQAQQLGTGHAVQQALPALAAGGSTLILNGDVPLIEPATLDSLLATCAARDLALLTVDLDDPSGYGRVLRGAGGAVAAIVEHKDASEAQRAVREVYSGVMAAPTHLLAQWVNALRNDNAQREYYLTDVVAMAVSAGVPVHGVKAPTPLEVAGVNSPAQLAQLERAHQRAQADRLLEAGVRLADPARLDVRGELHCAADVEIDVNCIFEGVVSLGEGVRVGAHCVIKNARIAAGAVIHPFTHIEGGLQAQEVRVGEGALIGPFARLRPGAHLGREVHVGNFVEVKNSQIAAGAKANHLAYLGDASVGERVNFGAGSITANYDGANKHRTTIGADVHVGSNCVLIAPVTLGEGGTIGGGSTISKDTPPGQLTVARAKQLSIPGWKRPLKKP